MKSFTSSFIFLFLFFFSASSYSQLWKQYADSAKIYKDQNQMSRALDNYNKAWDEIKKDSTGTITYANIISNVGVLSVIIGQYEKAEPLLLEAKSIREKILGKNDSSYAASCLYLGLLYAQTGQYEKAETLYMESKSIVEKVDGKGKANYALICSYFGILYTDMGQYRKAEPFLLESKNLTAKLLGKESRNYLGLCNSLGILYVSMGQYKKAEPFYLEYMATTEKLAGKDNMGYALICNNLGNLNILAGQFEKAESLMLTAIAITEKLTGKESEDYAQCCNNLAFLYTRMGGYEKAESLYFQSKAIIEKEAGKEHPDYAMSCNNLGDLYLDWGQNEKAEPFYLEALKIREKALGKENPDYAATCNDLGDLYRSMGKYEKVEPFYLESLKIREKVLGKEHPSYASGCINLAELYKSIAQYEKSEAFYLEAIKIIEKSLGNESADYDISCNGLANVYWDMNKREKANDYFTETFNSRNAQVKKIFQFTNETEKQSYLKMTDGFTNYFLSFHTISPVHHGFAYDVLLANRNLILSSVQQLRQTVNNSGDTAIQNKYENWNAIKEQLAFWYAKPVAERPGYVKDLEEESNTTEKELTRLSSPFKNRETVNNASWKAIQQNLKPNEAAIEFADFNFYDGKTYTDSTYYIALLLRKDKPEPELIKLFEKKQLDLILTKKSNEENENINNLYTTAEYNSYKSIYTIIWRPLEKSLHDITKIYFSPSGNLHTIAFAALPIGNNKVLSDKYQLIELNTTASVSGQVPSFIDATDDMQLYGGVKYDADSTALKNVVYLHTFNKNNIASRSLPNDLGRSGAFTYLPGTEAEVESIKEQSGKKNYHATVLSGIDATEESFKALNGKSSPSVFHIATHGFFFPDPKENKDKMIARFESSGKVFKQSGNPLFRSGLLFAGANYAWAGKPVEHIEDGILTAYEVSNMYLPNTKLVVLSACETALGDIQGSEGVYGLQRAFKIAGVQNLVMSLWKVPDAATSEFMQAFYKNLFSKQSISDAFYHAQSVMKNKYRNDPYKWAAWILVR